MNTTMKEIAYMCGVSRGTVDRVLNNRGKVKKATADHIRKVAKSMGYREAPSLPFLPSAQFPMKIGVLINAIDHPYFTDILSGVIRRLERLSEKNISSIIKMSGGFDVLQQLHLLDELVQQNVNAIAITPANDPRITHKLESISSSGIPVVTISAILDHFEPFAFVGSNHYQSGRVAAGFAKQIISDGCKIAIVTSTNVMSGVSQRIKAFREVITSAYPHCTILDPIQSFDDDVIAYKALSCLFMQHHDIDLLFLAAGGYNGCFRALEDAELNYKLKIIAFDTQESNLIQLKNGVIAGILSQHPIQQGDQAIKILSEYLLKQKMPEQRQFFVPVNILVAESIDDNLVYFMQYN